MPPRPFVAICAALVMAMLAFGIARTAWVGDDAYITFRSIENWFSGYGLRWNVADRVQTFTCPLWMLLCSGGRAITGELYFTSLALSGGATIGTLFVLHKLAGSSSAALLALGLAAISSRCFIDYSTSGLENPLSHVLLASFVFVWCRVEQLGVEHLARRLLRLALIGALLATSRMDLSLLVLPAILAAAWQVGMARALPRLAIASLPFVGWLLFATFYYGTPFPSTAYAKLFAVGLPMWELALQGLCYFSVLVLRDPASAVVFLLAIAVCLRRSGRAQLPLALGMLLYLGYIIRIGGDFMAGRFFSSSWVLGIAILIVQSRHAALGARVLFALGLLVFACVQGIPAAIVGTGRAEDAFAFWRIHDVRQQGWVACGLLSPDRRQVLPNSISVALQKMGHSETVFEVHGVVGERGFQGGPQLHLVDPWLCDPVLCRLPTMVRDDWQISHFTRRVPVGYLELLNNGEDRFCDPHFARYAQAVLAVTRGELWSLARIAAAYDLMSGVYRADLEAYLAAEYWQPKPTVVKVSDLPPPVKEDTWWFNCQARVLYEGGLDVDFATPQNGVAIEIAFGPASVYRCEFCRGGQVLHAKNVQTDTRSEYGGMRPYRIELEAAASGFEQLRIRPLFRGAVMAVGAVQVLH